MASPLDASRGLLSTARRSKAWAASPVKQPASSNGIDLALVAAVLTAWLWPMVAGAQTVTAPKEGAARPAPAPPRDLSGIWEPVRALDGIQPSGALNMPADGKPEHALPYTPFGLEMVKRNKSSNGPNQVAPAD